MSVIVWGMDMPPRCSACDFNRGEICTRAERYCAERDDFYARPEWCPLEEYDEYEGCQDCIWLEGEDDD